jgi:transcriptional regulator with XRE-family HTH domain
METKDKLGEEIRKIREENLKMTQKDLARELDITAIYVSYLEQGKRVPSIDLLEKLYGLIGIDEVPPKIKKMLGESKEKKKKENIAQVTPNVVYLFEQQGVFNYPKLKKLLETNPDDPELIYAMLILLLREKKVKEAEQHLFQSLMKLNKPEDKKWLQASYHKLEGDLPLAIELMQRSIEEFNKNYLVLDEVLTKKKAHLLFQMACMYYDYGQALYHKDSNKKSAPIKNYHKALEYHEEIRKIYRNPAYQMDYSGIFFWLALLGETPQKNWQRYISEAKEALALNYYEGMNNFPSVAGRNTSANWKSVYSKPYIIATISFLARTYGQLAILESNHDKKKEYITEGQFLFIQNTPIEIRPELIEYYRFYFNQACFYSIKAEINYQLKEDYSQDLELCHKALQEAGYADSKNINKLFKSELESGDGLEFYKKQAKKEVENLISEAKKVK